MDNNERDFLTMPKGAIIKRRSRAAKMADQIDKHLKRIGKSSPKSKCWSFPRSWTYDNNSIMVQYSWSSALCLNQEQAQEYLKYLNSGGTAEHFRMDEKPKECQKNGNKTKDSNRRRNSPKGGGTKSPDARLQRHPSLGIRDGGLDKPAVARTGSSVPKVAPSRSKGNKQVRTRAGTVRTGGARPMDSKHDRPKRNPSKRRSTPNKVRSPEKVSESSS